MSSHLCLSVTFLSPYFHGRRDGGDLEWPPSPLRVFQSLVAATAAGRLLEDSRVALQWLEQQPAPLIVAPVGESGGGYRLSVPNNSMDVVSRAWARGGGGSPATHRTMKGVTYTRVLDEEDFPAAHYIWSLPDPIPVDVQEHVHVLSRSARRAVALGWGIDLIAGHGRVLSPDEIEDLPGERWEARTDGSYVALRIPMKGTLAALEKRHAAWLQRLTRGGETLRPVQPLRTYEVAGYCRATDQARRPFAAFSLRNHATGRLRAYDPLRRTAAVAGMLRHSTSIAATRGGWSDIRIARFVLGHGEERGAANHASVDQDRFAYIPVPTIEWRGTDSSRVVGDIRRAIVYSFAPEREEEVQWCQRSLSGQDLIDERQQKPVALLAPISGPDNVVQQYIRDSSCWTTVTPVILPGYDDPRGYRQRLRRTKDASEQKRLLQHLEIRTERLLRRAIRQAGFSTTLATYAKLEWRRSGFLPGTGLADQYAVPDHLVRYPRLHVRITWNDQHGNPVQVPGPVCIGSGRFYGLGLFVSL